MSEKITSFLQIVDDWKKTLDYKLLENEHLKPLLKNLDIENYRLCTSMNLATLILAASIHHGIKTKEISKIACEILPNLQLKIDPDSLIQFPKPLDLDLRFLKPFSYFCSLCLFYILFFFCMFFVSG